MGQVRQVDRTTASVDAAELVIGICPAEPVCAVLEFARLDVCIDINLGQFKFRKKLPMY